VVPAQRRMPNALLAACDAGEAQETAKSSSR
jgi:hypothetical protein